MIDPTLPTAVLLAAIALAWLPAGSRGHLAAVALIAGSYGLMSVVGPPNLGQGLMPLTWLLVVAACTFTILDRPVRAPVMVASAILAGSVIAMHAAAVQRPALLFVISPVLLLLTLARWRRHAAVRLGKRVVAAWLTAIALLSFAVPLVTTTPGYRKDHME